MKLHEKLGNRFVITTELGPVKGVLTDASLEKAAHYRGLDGTNVHDCPMANLRINSIAMGDIEATNRIVSYVEELSLNR